jgi:2-polyprenyl-3-methyl-5-hydroxy-6-metoxy-1,4-benzoquinol methylase
MASAMVTASFDTARQEASWAARALYGMARLVYRTELAHSREMKAALAEREASSAYRSAEFTKITAAAAKYGIALAGKRVLDLGCNDGSISPQYVQAGAASVVGVDIDEGAIARAQQRLASDRVSFALSTVEGIPLPDASIDTICCYDVMEHVAKPAELLKECFRVMAPGGQMLVGTWGWWHPFAPHLWAVMPVPWAHVLVSERSLLQASRLVYHSPWYVPNMHDFDASGSRLADKYNQSEISRDYLNKYFIRDFRRVLRESPFEHQMHLVPFGSKWAFWTRPLVHVPVLQELFTGYLWMVLTKPRA